MNSGFVFFFLSFFLFFKVLNLLKRIHFQQHRFIFVYYFRLLWFSIDINHASTYLWT
ncbi:hypothetical protein Hanom_Chr10g00932031 [Helianthus anomalus]